VPKLSLARRAAMSATVLAAAATATLATTGSAHAAGSDGLFLYSNSSPGCVATLDFERVPSGNNLAQADIQTFNAQSYDSCVGALYRSSDAGRTWYRISGVHTLSGDGPNESSYTYWYADGAAYLAKACVRTYFGHTDTFSSWACTSAH
jgi:hypothetical protein